MQPHDVLEAPFVAVPDLVRRHAAERPSHIAVWQEDVRGVRCLDYAAFDALVDRIAAALQRDGVDARDVVTVCATNSIEYAALFIGVLRAGACVAPLPTSASPETLALMRADSGAKLHVTERELDRLESWIAAPGSRPRPVTIEPDWPFNIIYSSGTTGTPKGIVHPHAMRWVHVQRSARLGYGAEAVTLVSTPLYSNTTLVSFLPTLGAAATLARAVNSRPGDSNGRRHAPAAQQSGVYWPRRQGSLRVRGKGTTHLGSNQHRLTHVLRAACLRTAGRTRMEEPWRSPCPLVRISTTFARKPNGCCLNFATAALPQRKRSSSTCPPREK